MASASQSIPPDDNLAEMDDIIPSTFDQPICETQLSSTGNSIIPDPSQNIESSYYDITCGQRTTLTVNNNTVPVQTPPHLQNLFTSLDSIFVHPNQLSTNKNPTVLPSEIPELSLLANSTDEENRNSFIGYNYTLPELPSSLIQSQLLGGVADATDSNPGVQGQHTQIPILNSTLRSSNTGRVLLICIQDENANDLFTNPFKINKLLTNSDSPLKTIQMADMRVNRLKKLIIVEATDKLSTSFLENITKITKLGTYSVRCYQPNSDSTVHGIIGPFAVDVELDSLKESLQFTPPLPIHQIERMKRRINGKLEDSLSIKLTFKGTDLPIKTKLFGLSYKIRPFVHSPVQCYNCQRYGHTAGSCKGVKRCLLCAGNHSKDQCQSEKYFCANCKGSHVASSRECPHMVTAREVENVKAKEKVPHQEARNLVASRQRIDVDHPNNILNPVQSPSNTNVHGPLLYSRAVRNSLSNNTLNTPNTDCQQCKCKKSIQSCNISTQTERDTDTLTEDFYINLRNFILDISTKKFNKESRNSKVSLADSSIKNHFGIDLKKCKSNQNPEEPVCLNETFLSASEGQNTAQKRAAISSSDDTGVLSNDTVWHTIEKKQVRKKSRHPIRDDDNNGRRVTRSKNKNNNNNNE